MTALLWILSLIVIGIACYFWGKAVGFKTALRIKECGKDIAKAIFDNLSKKNEDKVI